MGNRVTLYKYCSVNTAVKILSNNSIRLTSPLDFSDKLDSYLDTCSKEEHKKLEELVLSYAIFNDFMKLNEGKIKSEKFKKIPLGIKFELNVLEKSIKKFRFFEPTPLIKHYAKSLRLTVNEKEKHLNSIFSNFEKDLKKAFEEIREDALIGCFTKSFDNNYMWDRYGDASKGICIEFEDNDSKYFNIEYKESIPKLDVYFITQISLAHQYLNIPVSIKNKNLNKKLLGPFLIKTNKYSNEEEVRCIYSKSNIQEANSLVIKQNDGYYYLKIHKIKSVYLGPCISYDDRNRIKELLKNNDINVIDLEIEHGIYTKKRTLKNFN